MKTIAPNFELRQGDSLEVLRSMPDESIHCAVTSPPYWGLRDYQCEGQIGLEEKFDCGARSKYEYVGDYEIDDYDEDPETGDMVVIGKTTAPLYRLLERRKICGGCWMCRMVEIFRELRRVLRDDGTFWLNIGDSYAGGGKGGGGSYASERPGWNKHGREHLGNLKPKDLIGQPWALAFALRDDGWWLRSDIIWQKPNPMPESVTDRPTKSHEHIFLLTKSARYFYDAEAVREASTERPSGNKVRKRRRDAGGNPDYPGDQAYSFPYTPDGSGRNLRDVWTMATQACSYSHYATFPEELPKKCIMAGTSARGVCPECGAPWVRVVEKDEKLAEARRGSKDYQSRGLEAGNKFGSTTPGYTTKSKTLGFRPSCECKFWFSASGKQHQAEYGDYETYEPIPATVLDPFSGTGTTGKVALDLGRNYVGIEINPADIEYSRKRLTKAARQTSLPLGI